MKLLLIVSAIARHCHALSLFHTRSEADGRPDLVPAAKQRVQRPAEAVTLTRWGGKDELEEKVDEKNCQTRSNWAGPDLTDPYRQQALSEWQSLASNTYERTMRPKPAFLMMVYMRVVFEKSWETFFRMGGQNTSTLLINSKYPASQVSEFFSPYLMWEDVPTAWCRNGGLMIRMMGLALADPDVSHFIVVSGDTLPIKTLGHISQDLEKDWSSRFCVDSDWLRAETWFTMQRGHAELFAQHESTLRTLIPPTGICEDEDLFYWPLAMRQEAVTDQCMMMTDWSRTEKFWNEKTEKCNCPEFLNSTKAPSSCRGPAVFYDVSTEGLKSLLSSSAGYWFVRKFLGDGLSGVTTYQGSDLLDDEMASRLKVKYSLES